MDLYKFFNRVYNNQVSNTELAKFIIDNKEYSKAIINDLIEYEKNESVRNDKDCWKDFRNSILNAYSKSSKKTFPFFVKLRGVPNNHSNLYLLIHNIDFIISYLEQKKQNKFSKGYYSPHITYESYKRFDAIIDKFADEITNNIENNQLQYKNLLSRVNELKSKLDHCIGIIENNKNEFFMVEMHNPYQYDKENNWYKLIYDDLISLNNIVLYFNAINDLNHESKTEPNIDAQNKMQKVLLIIEFGIIDYLKNECNISETQSFKILGTLTDINYDLIRRYKQGYKQGKDFPNKSNNNNPETEPNRIWLTNLLNTYKINKIK